MLEKAHWAHCNACIAAGTEHSFQEKPPSKRYFLGFLNYLLLPVFLLQEIRLSLARGGYTHQRSFSNGFL